MVKLSLVSPKGNQGVRYFPYQGCLGLTPLRFEGLVRTQIEQDGKTVLARDILVAVRCYESRHGRLGALQTNVLYEYSVTLWQKQEPQEWSEVGDSEYPFRFSLPSHIAAPSTALYFQEYRIFWRIEAVLNHVPISAVGCRQIKFFELPLVRYDAPASLSPPTPLTPSPSSYVTLLRSKFRSSPLRYRILVPPNPIGPLDIVTIQLIVQPLDSSVSIRSTSAFVERRIHFSAFRVSPSESPPGTHPFSPSPPVNSQVTCNHAQDGGLPQYPGSNGSSSQELLFSTSMCSGDSSQPLLLQHEDGADESAQFHSGGRGTTTHIFAHAESAGRFSRDSSGVWQHKLTFSWPDTKSNSRWAVGESVQTGMASVKFFLRVKLIVSSPTNSAETVELEDKELIIVSTNDLQRRLAYSRYSNWLNTTSGRSTSKSPRRFKRDRQTEQLPSPPHSPRHPVTSDEPGTVTGPMRPPFSTAHNHNISTASSPFPGRNSNTFNVSRRPYTSAGEWPSKAVTRPYENVHDQTSELAVPVRPETAHPTRSQKSSQSSVGFFRQRSDEMPRLGSCGGHPATESGSLFFERVNMVDVQAWEKELTRIESASRRNSVDVLGILCQRKKASGESPSIPTQPHSKR